MNKHPAYPDTLFYLSHSGKYFFRHPDLRHLRIEQVNRYFAFGDGEHASENLEDTLGDEEDEVDPCLNHRHYDKFAQDMPAGTLMHSTAQGVPGLRRRKPGRLAVSRVPFLEPIGARREAFYEQRLLLGLAWFCSEPPIVDESGAQRWRFAWTPPEDAGAADLEPLELWIGTDAISFERRCHEIEKEFCASDHNLVCECCAMSLPNVCPNCEFAVGFHWCVNPQNSRKEYMRWKKGSLFAGALDIERCLFNLYRKGLKIEILKEKADEYVLAGLISLDKARSVCKSIEEERGHQTIVNEQAASEAPADAEAAAEGNVSSRLSAAALKKELEEREKNMQAGAPDGGVTDQWRVYQHVIQQLQTGSPLRLMVQASAGTGNSADLGFDLCYGFVFASSDFHPGAAPVEARVTCSVRSFFGVGGCLVCSHQNPWDI